MPYEYRKLTPEEREAIREQRRARGYPLHEPPHPYRHTGTYFLTAANFEHQPIMATPDRRTEFETRLLTTMAAIQAQVWGWVVLLNHYHLLVGVDSLNQISKALKLLHGATAYEWNLADGLTGKRTVWYKFADRMIRNDQHFYTALNYIHINPVKHGYVDSPYDWLWSSVHEYLDTQGQQWLRQQWTSFPPNDFGTGWDD
jgi:putative transposase